MNVDEAEEHLRQMLADTGFDAGRPDVALAWQVFQKFADLPFESGGGRECEELWFEAGDGDPAADSPGYFDFVRKFSQETEDEVSWDEMITAHFTCVPDVRLGLKGTIHADMADVQGWFRKVEASRSFRAGLGFAGWSFEVRLDGA